MITGLAGCDSWLLLDVAQLIADVCNKGVFFIRFDPGARSGLECLHSGKIIFIRTRDQLCPSLEASAIEIPQSCLSLFIPAIGDEDDGHAFVPDRVEKSERRWKSRSLWIAKIQASKPQGPLEGRYNCRF